MGSYINRQKGNLLNSLPLLCHTKIFFWGFSVCFESSQHLAFHQSCQKTVLPQLKLGRQPRQTSLMELDEQFLLAIVVNIPSTCNKIWTCWFKISFTVKLQLDPVGQVTPSKFRWTTLDGNLIQEKVSFCVIIYIRRKTQLVKNAQVIIQ